MLIEINENYYKEVEAIWGKFNLELIIKDFVAVHPNHEKIGLDLRTMLFNSYMSGLNSFLNPSSNINQRYDWIEKLNEERKASNETPTNG